MFVCCECCVFSGRGLGDGLITRPEESYRMWRVVMRDQETSNSRRLKPLDSLKHSLKPFVRGSHLVSSITLDQVWASCGPRGGRNNNNCGLMEFVNIVIPKVLIFVNVSLYRP